jgi:GH35 family endo-1,4-beta-xylanase
MQPHLLAVLAVLVGMNIPATAFGGWREDADARIEEIRKGDFTVTVVDGAGKPVARAKFEARLKHHAFLFGTAINHRAFSDETEFGRAYRQFILDHFSGLVCENEMKWYDTEEVRGVENYGPADALLAFAEEHGLMMRGHCLFWAKPDRNEEWVKELSPDELRREMVDRLNSIVPRYAGRLVAWDANNEMLDGSLFRDRLGPDTGAWIWREAAKLDPRTPLHVNEYAILGETDRVEQYLALIADLQRRGAVVGGIGIQSHDSDRLTDDANAAAIDDNRAEGFLKRRLTPAAFLRTLDRLHDATGLPVHLTEISARTPDVGHRGRSLEMLFRLGFSHASVEAILLWGFHARSHWMGPDAALVDADGTINPAGQRISRLLREEWTTRHEGATGAAGAANFRGFFGTYVVKVTLPDGRVVEREVVLSKSAPTATVVP